jgi:hypothetical protein
MALLPPLDPLDQDALYLFDTLGYTVLENALRPEEPWALKSF